VKNTSSTVRELFALQQAIKAESEFVRSKHILVQMDSQTSTDIIRKASSRSKGAHQILKEIWHQCRAIKCDLRVQWIPREENKEADLLSRLQLEISATLRQAIIKWAVDRRLTVQFELNEISSTNKMTVIRPDENFIEKAILLARCEKWRIGILHPNWKAQAWHLLTRLPQTVLTTQIDDNILNVWNFSSM
jgi:hypothetical protein